MKEIPARVKEKERLTNQFLLQLLFGILSAVGVYLVYRGYNSSRTVLAMPIIITVICCLAAALVLLFLMLWTRAAKKGISRPTLRNAAFYSLACSVSAMWLIIYKNKINGVKVLFAAIGVFLAVAFVVYVIRFYWGNKLKKRRK